VPGLHKDQPAAENFELRRQKIPGIHLLELIVKALDVVGSMILQQCLSLFINIYRPMESAKSILR